MKSFTYAQAFDEGTDATLLAGGTDLLPLMKIGRLAPDQVVDVKRGAVSAGVERTEDGWRIGAGTTLSDLERDGSIAELGVVHDAVSSTATRQIRNRATIGGNLLQRSRCWYYRDPTATCWLAGGEECLARDGRNDHHAIFDTGTCISTQPSDLAAALVALDATVSLRVDGERRDVAVSDLLQPPTADCRTLNVLAENSLVEAITIPVHEQLRSCYGKAMDRAAWQFALVGVAAVLSADGPRLVASGVASIPWRLSAAEARLDGRDLDDRTIAAASAAAADGATALEHNGYKIQLLRGLTRRALEALR